MCDTGGEGVLLTTENGWTYNDQTDNKEKALDRLTNMWVNRPLQINQLGQLSLLSFRDR